MSQVIVVVVVVVRVVVVEVRKVGQVHELLVAQIKPFHH